MQVKRLFAVSFGHFSIDVLNSSIAMILTAVSGFFHLSVSQIAFAAMIYTFAAALTQPLFGIVADRLQGRWLSAVGLLWTMTFFALAPLMPNFGALVTCLTIGALGSGAFHPTGMINATASGGRYATTATSIFFVLGQSGLAMGPLLSGVIIQTMGLRGLPLMAVAALPAAVLMLTFTHRPLEEAEHRHALAEDAPRTGRSAATQGAFVAVAFILLIALRSTTQQSFSVLLPKFFDNQGYEPAVYGAMIGAFSLFGALGTFVGGYLGDRFNRRQVIFVAMMLAVPFLLILVHAQGLGFFVGAAFGGMFMNIPHSILLLMAQRLLPKRRGMMGGAVLGFMFASGAAMAWFAGWAADQVGLQLVLNVLACVPIGAGICALLLPSTRGAVFPPAPAPPQAQAAAD